MTGIPKPPLDDAARSWLASEAAADPVFQGVRAALVDFVEGRYRGAAPALRRIHEFRLGMIGDARPLRDLAEAGSGPWDGQSLGAAAAASAPPDQGRLLFQLIRTLAPRRVLELGTNIGISAAYIVVAMDHAGGGQLVTIEASGIRVALARRFLDQLGLLGGVDLIEGYFDDVLESVLADHGPFDVVFLDGNHRLEPTLRYTEMLVPGMPAGGVIVLDDIRWSQEMLEAWTRVCGYEGLATVDLGRTGLAIIR